MSNPEIRIVQNTLFVDGGRLERQTTRPEDLEHILLVGRQSILRGIHEFYEATVARNPGARVVHPSINVMNLGKDSKRRPVLTDFGRQNNTGLYTDITNIALPTMPYWEAVKHASFIPEARLWADDTISLLVRDEPLQR